MSRRPKGGGARRPARGACSESRSCARSEGSRARRKAPPATGRSAPARLAAVLFKSGLKIELTITPNLGGHIASTFTLELTRAGRPVRAAVSAVFTMQAMPMPSLGLMLKPRAPGIYQGSGEKLTMPGRWQIRLRIVARHQPPLEVVLIDIATVE